MNNNFTVAIYVINMQLFKVTGVLFQLQCSETMNSVFSLLSFFYNERLVFLSYFIRLDLIMWKLPQFSTLLIS